MWPLPDGALGFFKVGRFQASHLQGSSMQGSMNRDGWTPVDEEDLQTANPPSRTRFEKAGREQALLFAQEEIARLRLEIDEIAHTVDLTATTISPPRRSAIWFATLILLTSLAVLRRTRHR